MPRIAASIAVIALIVFSVGFNISQYPIVWEASDASSHLLPSVESLQAKTASDSAKLPPAEDLTQQYAVQRPVDEQPSYEEPAPYEPVPYESLPYARYTPPEEPSYQSFEPSEAAIEPSNPDTSYDFVALSPQVVESTAKYGADADSSTTAIAGLPARRMVPVIIPKSAQPADDLAETSGMGPSSVLPSGSSESDESVRRLPPIDQVNAVPEDHQAVQLPMTPIPIYPTTGF